MNRSEAVLVAVLVAFLGLLVFAAAMSEPEPPCVRWEPREVTEYQPGPGCGMRLDGKGYGCGSVWIPVQVRRDTCVERAPRDAGR